MSNLKKKAIELLEGGHDALVITNKHRHLIDKYIFLNGWCSEILGGSVYTNADTVVNATFDYIENNTDEYVKNVL